MRIVLLFFLCIFLAAPAVALESSYEKRMAHGVEEVNGGNYAKAAEEFQAALAEKPDDADATLYYGVSLSRMKNEKAEVTLLRALKVDPENPRVHLELGIHYASLHAAEAADYFATVQSMAPGTELAESARSFRERLGTGEKRWGLGLIAGMQFDSNVIMASNGTALPAGITGRSDWVGVIAGRGAYSLVEKDAWGAALSGSLYQSLHTKLTDFDITQGVAEASGRYRLTPDLALRGAYSFEYLFLGGNPYDTAHTLSPSVVYSFREGWRLTGDYRLRQTSFKNSDLFGANSDRSGWNNSLGVTQELPAFGGTMRGSYSHEWETTRDPSWELGANRFMIGYSRSLPFGIGGDAETSYTLRDYVNPFPGEATPRSERLFAAALNLSRKLTEHLALTAGFLYNRNLSDTADFDYVRSITSIMLSARF